MKKKKIANELIRLNPDVSFTNRKISEKHIKFQASVNRGFRKEVLNVGIRTIAKECKKLAVTETD